jgi:hypothetical protein
MMYTRVAYGERQCCAAARHDNMPPNPCSDEQQERLVTLRDMYDEVTRRQHMANQHSTQPIQDRHYLRDAVIRRRQDLLEQAAFNGRFQVALNALYDIASRAK